MADELTELRNRDNENTKKTETLLGEIEKVLSFLLACLIGIFQLSTMVSVSQQLDTSMPESSTTTTSTRRRTSYEPADTQPAQFAQIVSFMRTEKHRETELRMNAELDVQRLQAQHTVDAQKIQTLEARVIKLTNEIDANIQALSEKDKLVSDLNVLRQVQQQYNTLKREFDALKAKEQSGAAKVWPALNDSTSRRTVSSGFVRVTTLPFQIKGLEGALTSAHQAKVALEQNLKSTQTQLEAQQKEVQELRTRNDQIMTTVGKYSPEEHNKLQ